MTDVDGPRLLENGGIVMSMPPGWDASTPDRLLAVSDDLLAAAKGEMPGFEPMLTRFFEFAGARPDLLIAWLFLPLTTDEDEVRGLLFASLVAGVVENVRPWPEGTTTVSVGPWEVVRTRSRVREAIDDENSLEVLVFQYDISISDTSRMVCEFRSPNVFLADQLADHFDQMVSAIRVVPSA